MLLTAREVRVLGSLIENQLAIPDLYPLMLNSLVHACNQMSNRNPVVSYDESTVLDALQALRDKQLVRIVYSRSNRAAKYRQVLEEAVGLTPKELAVLSVLLLRGPQTLGEMRARSERLAGFADLGDVEQTLEGLAHQADDPLVVQLDRMPGQKEARYAHLLAGEPAALPGPAPGSGAGAEREPAGVDRLAALEEELEGIKAELAELRAEVTDLRRQWE